MGGVVFGANGASGLGKFSAPITLAAGAVPPGTWILQQAGTLTVDTGVTVTVPLGTMIQSDGKNLATAAGGGVLLGARPKPVWPWPKAWPGTGYQIFTEPLTKEPGETDEAFQARQEKVDKEQQDAALKAHEEEEKKHHPQRPAQHEQPKNHKPQGQHG